MKQKLILAMIVAFAAVAFQGTGMLPSLKVAAGKYGITGSVVLKLNSDGTFRYCDNTIHTAINVSGRWVQRGNVIILNDHNAPRKIHDRWKMDGSSSCLKARKGLEWRRLCYIG